MARLSVQSVELSVAMPVREPRSVPASEPWSVACDAEASGGLRTTSVSNININNRLRSRKGHRNTIVPWQRVSTVVATKFDRGGKR